MRSRRLTDDQGYANGHGCRDDHGHSHDHGHRGDPPYEVSNHRDHVEARESDDGGNDDDRGLCQSQSAKKQRGECGPTMAETK